MAEYRKKATDLKINVFLFTYIFYIYYTLIKLEIKAVFWRKSNKLYYFSPNLYENGNAFILYSFLQFEYNSTCSWYLNLFK